jgi:FAD/FMN-containing dehydrogenase
MAGATVVLANSTVVNCSLTENADLFWALRGAGSSFGIVTSFRFNTFDASSTVTVFSSNLPWNNAQQAAAGWTALQDWVTNTMPAEMNMRILGMSYSTQLQGLYYGPKSALQEAIAPLMTLLNATLGQTQETDYMGGFAAYDNGDQVDVSHPYNMVWTPVDPLVCTVPRVTNRAMCTARTVLL